MAVERTLILIMPDAMRRGLAGEIQPRFDEPHGGVEYQLASGECITVLCGSKFEIERLVEVQATADAREHPYCGDPTVEWARKWPGEEIWVARKRG